MENPEASKLTKVQPTAEEIASAIVDISAAMKRIDASRLNRHALEVLLQAMTKMPRQHIAYVLNSLAQLEQTYLKARPTKGKVA